MEKTGLLFIVVLILVPTLFSSAYPNTRLGIDISNNQYSDFFKPEKDFHFGKSSGVPFALGYRFEHTWNQSRYKSPKWVSAIDFGLLLPGIKISTERRIQHSNFYIGLGYTYVYVPIPIDFFDDFHMHAISFPISYRKSDPWELGRLTHYSFSFNLYSFDFVTWEAVPMFQITIFKGF